MRRRFSYGYHLVLDCCFQAVAWCLRRNDTMAENEGKNRFDYEMHTWAKRSKLGRIWKMHCFGKARCL